MVKRFNNLKAALKSLRSPTATPDSVAPSPPEGSILANFKDVYTKAKVVTYTRAADSKPGSLKVASLVPFGAESTSTDRYFVDISDRALDKYTITKMSDTVLGIDTTVTSSDAGNLVTGFTPAKAVITVVGTGTTETPSKITGLKYKNKGNKSYTYPMGQTTDEKVMSKRQAKVLAAAATADNLGVSFKPEIFK
ncbi:hypothetical protein A0J48_016135 [Sphaerospermopsis aphanizomenoides BCCUSP55]|uniref:hypothetical protein n=1 Tax=Sphaerospermopsis aphanizomenoides TaxID=459663 RepID=UPI001907A187|nr:hypothetical protein [Sphaerospermopsis aphanizomenoides]MBK1989050.1 hypothetical protein [Sphaerospermopsis aphanizomenoides BCCUSP55]